MYNLLSLMFYVAACGEECPEVATQDYSDVEDIPIPSQNREDDTTDSNSGDEEGSSVVVEEPDTTENEEEKEEQEEAQSASTINYSFTDVDSLLYVQVFKDTSAWGSGLSHDHVMRAANPKYRHFYRLEEHFKPMNVSTNSSSKILLNVLLKFESWSIEWISKPSKYSSRLVLLKQQQSMNINWVFSGVQISKLVQQLDIPLECSSPIRYVQMDFWAKMFWVKILWST